MSRLVLLCMLFAAIFFCAQVQSDETSINFYFADMLAGVNQPSNGNNPGSPSNGSSYIDESYAEEAFDIEQTIYGLFAVNERASNDEAANVNYNTYGSLVSPFVTSDVVLSSINSLLNNGAPDTYNGVSGVVQYFNDLASSRSSSRQQLTNLIFDFGNEDCPTGTITVNATFSGIESLTADSSFQTFYGVRNYVLVRSPSSPYGYAIQSLVAIRYITRPSPDYTAFYTNQAQAAALALIQLNDQAGNGMAISDSQVSPLVTSNFSVTANVPAPNTVYASGPSAFVDFIANISADRVASQTQLSNFQYSFSADQSSVIIMAKATGYEFLNNGSTDIFYGNRSFLVVRGDDGVWRVEALTFVRTASFTQANGTVYPQ